MSSYCNSRFSTLRRKTREVKVGSVGVGGKNPIRVQSMTTSLTQDVEATVQQVIRLAEAGSEIVRITAPNKAAAQALKEIQAKVTQTGLNVPLVADIHFLPSAAMEAIEHVEKVRVNPGNYADKKKFAIIEYTDRDYEEELQRLYESFSPLVKRAKTLGKALRIGTNHGSLSDRIMNRYGDTPHGMVEAALEFIRIAESHGYHDMIVSLKSSNPKVMIQAYRLAAKLMAAEGMSYPLHLGVTEAGEGEDARIKSAIGIGALLADGLGDTIRVSLTEDPWFEIPVCQELVERTEKLWQTTPTPEETAEQVDFYEYQRREIHSIDLGTEAPVGTLEPPRVIVPSKHSLTEHAQIAKAVLQTHNQLRDNRIEGLLLKLETTEELPALAALQRVLVESIPAFVVEVNPNLPLSALSDFDWSADSRWVIVKKFDDANVTTFSQWASFCEVRGLLLAIDAEASTLQKLSTELTQASAESLIFTLTTFSEQGHALGAYRKLAAHLQKHAIKSPLWIRATHASKILEKSYFGGHLIEASIMTGALFCDGLGDLLSIETEDEMPRATTLAYNLLQGSRMRASKTEYVACPSCGRTLFDLQSTTQKIKSRTGHLKGVTIAVMGCIVNGPGEMADADFGYVGGAPKKVNLYVGKECVKYNIPEEEALDRLVDLIKTHNKWVEPTAEPVGA